MSAATHLPAPGAAASTPNVVSIPNEVEVVECPVWCERGQGHDAPNDLEHWTTERAVDGYMLMASMVTYGGRERFEIHLGEHTTLTLHAEQAVKLVAVLASCWLSRTCLGRRSKPCCRARALPHDR